MNLVIFNRGPDKGDLQSALEVVDKLREAIASGRVSGFIGVSIDDDDSTEAWCATTKRVSRLRTMGAIAHLQACFIAGDIG